MGMATLPRAAAAITVAPVSDCGRSGAEVSGAVEEFLRSLPGSVPGFPFGDDAEVCKVQGKMFSLISQGPDPRLVTLKCDPDDAEVLVANCESVSPGYYMNKRHWISIVLDGEVSVEEILGFCQDSYDLVVAGLTRKQRESLLAE